MERIWLKSYLPGMATDIDPGSLPSLKHMAEESFAKFPRRAAYIQMGRQLTFGELDRKSRDFASWLQNVAGLKRGDRLAIILPNVLQYPIAMFGALRAGLTVVNTNPLYTAPELEHQLKDSGCAAIVVLENFAHVLEKVLPRTAVRHVITTSVGELLGFPKSHIVDFVVRRVHKQVPPWNLPGAVNFSAVLAAGQAQALKEIDLTHEDVAFLQYTGGTTGVAKGAVLTHGNICANLLQASAWIDPFLPSTVDAAQYLITPIPLYHIFALTANCMLFLRRGWTNVLITNPRDFPRFIKELRQYPFCLSERRQHAVQCAAQYPRLRRRGFQPPENHPRRRHGRAGDRRQALEGGDRKSSDPGVGIDRDFTRSLHQSAGHGFQWLDRPADCLDRDFHSRRCGHRSEPWRAGEICVRGPQVMRGLLESPG